MEVQCSPFSWDFCYQEDQGIAEELRHSLLCTTLELETTILSAKEKIARREEELVHIKDLLSKTLRERDEAQAQCQRLVLDKTMLQKELQKHHHQQQQQQEKVLLAVAAQDEEVMNESKGSESDENCNIASSISDPIVKALPEKGKLLQAVIDAGPLLQSLLLAGPLPQWQNPPPQLNSIEIPPVAISPPPPSRLLHQEPCISSSSGSCLSNKRSLVSSDVGLGSDSSPNTKYQKVT